MARGAWKGSGTWETSGPDLRVILLVAVVAVLGGSGAAVAIATTLLTILIVAAVVAVAAVAVTLWLIWRFSGSRGMVTRPAPPSVTATARPQVTQATARAIENHVHYHVHVGEHDAAAVRAVLPGTAGDAITEGN
jgi:membrane protein implicated in regulation of membrane protease activity